MQWSRYQCTCLQSFIKDCLTLVHTFSRILLQQLAKNATKFSELWCLFWVRANALSTIRLKQFWNSGKFSIRYSINVHIKNLTWKLLKLHWYKNASATQGRKDIFLSGKIAKVQWHLPPPQIRSQMSPGRFVCYEKLILGCGLWAGLYCEKKVWDDYEQLFRPGF